VRRAGEIHRVCEEEEESHGGEETPWFKPEPQERLDSSRRRLTIALVGAVVGIVAVLAIHGLRSSGTVVRGSGAVVQSTAVGPAAPGAAAPKNSPPRRSRAGSRIDAVGRRTAGGVHDAASAVAPPEIHAPVPATAKVPAGAEYELGFER
jgi:hypothetical protein